MVSQTTYLQYAKVRVTKTRPKQTASDEVILHIHRLQTNIKAPRVRLHAYKRHIILRLRQGWLKLNLRTSTIYIKRCIKCPCKDVIL